MIGWIIFIFVWVVLACIASRFGKKAKEQDWGSFILVNLIPIIGAVFSIMVYSRVIAENERKVQ